ncbi:uncharacterized protein LOC128739665 [Sabethes cyaneus]|uniref:uncharacterized protein LOC128739665 n=1 Tax=Sabethes cyaneus TaxID=53552 RepID=UPI00237E48B3|nr:uncharacterized protein LOC128739665 [Sabethes cyaneus]
MNTARLCAKCNSEGLPEHMIGCDRCEVWLHHECAGLTVAPPNSDQSWICEKCAQEDVGELLSQRSKKTTTSTSSQARRVELELKQFAEKQELMQKQRAEEDEIRRRRAEEDSIMLTRKYELLQTAEQNTSNRSQMSSRVSREKVRSWLGAQNNNIMPAAVKPTNVTANRPPTTELGGNIVNQTPLANPLVAEIHRADKKIISHQAIPQSTSTPHSGQDTTTIPAITVSNGPTATNTVVSFAICNAIPATVALTTQSGELTRQPILTNTVAAAGAASNFVTANVPYGQMKSSEFRTNPQTSYATMPVRRDDVRELNSQAQDSRAWNSAVPQFYQSAYIPAQLAIRKQLTNADVTTQAQFQQTQTAQQQGGTESVNLLQQETVSGPGMQGNTNQPNSIQLAARQVIPRELPSFSGDPEDWPLFCSAFYNSTAACGYTDAENLCRLQKCLKGNALTEVKSRLLLPESVPYIMETLRKRFGKPEILVLALLKKVRDVPPPKSENLQSIINFGSAVRNLVDHLYIAKLGEHLRNPMIVHELVEKLSPQLKMQWSWYKRVHMDVSLATFGDFVTDLADAASDVSMPVCAFSSEGFTKQQPENNRSGRIKQKLYAHTATEGDSINTTETPNINSISNKKTCAYCSNSSHIIAECPQFNLLDLDERWKAIRIKGLCRTCLIPHRKWPCRSYKDCGVDGCRLRHHSLLHTQSPARLSNKLPNFSGESVTHQNHHLSRNDTVFRYVPITLENNEIKVETFAFLDDGCSSTLMEAGLATELGIVGPTEPLSLAWTGDISREEKGSQRISVTVAGRGLKKKYKLSNVRTVQQLKLQSQTLQYDELRKMYPHLTGLPLHSYTDSTPRMIIGMEHAQLLTSLEVREGRLHEPVAAKTRLGWCLYGKRTGGRNSIEQLHLHSEGEIGNRELHELMRQYFSIEEATVKTPLESDEDKRARKILETTTRRIEGGFETGLLWKYDQLSFPNTYPMAIRRMHSLEKRLDKDPILRMRVNEMIAEYESKGYAHRITTEELITTDRKRVWYLPLGVVRNPKKPNKIRLIWDAAARVNGMALNDFLLKGPDMISSLFDILLRFRQRSVAVCGDIREMFHQIRIIPIDKQSQRFVHRDHPSLDPQIYVMDVATFGATCSPCLAQFIKNMNASEFVKIFPQAADAIVNSHYVDDFLGSVDTVEEAVQLVEEIKHVHLQGGFEIRNFSSNSPAVLVRIGETRNAEKKSMALDLPLERERVLGMVWCTAMDVFTFDVTLSDDLNELLREDCIPTKRQVLRLVMSLFDPYGFIAHYIVHGKILMQHIWRSGTDWDEKISKGLLGPWRDWISLIKELSKVEVPRCFFGSDSSKPHSGIQLHTFVDASELAYGCVAYLRIVQGGRIKCALVAAKTKVSPLKPVSIPRLELQGGLIGCRLMDSICETLTLPLEKRFVWTDSKTTLAWVRSDGRKYHPYVAFRIGEILNLSNVDEWHYVPSKLNVADVATKWGNGPEFHSTNRWYVGPSFLSLPEHEWPKQPEQKSDTKITVATIFGRRDEENTARAVMMHSATRQNVQRRRQKNMQRTQIFQEIKRCLAKQECAELKRLFSGNEKVLQKVNASRTDFVSRAKMYREKNCSILTDDREETER